MKYHCKYLCGMYNDPFVSVFICIGIAGIRWRHGTMLPTYIVQTT